MASVIRKYRPRRWATSRRLLIKIGTVFGSWTVVGQGEQRPPSKHIYWRCQCECGTVRDQKATVLNKGRAKACGCKISEASRIRATKHGMADTSIYKIWRGMISRCERTADKDYKRYGARGITVCKKWHDFPSFYRDVGDRPSVVHSLGRIHNDGNYEPSNVRWEMSAQQSNNRRSSRLITHDGRTLTATQWSQQVGITSSALCARLNAGWPVDKALSLPRQDTRATQNAK